MGNESACPYATETSRVKRETTSTYRGAKTPWESDGARRIPRVGRYSRERGISQARSQSRTREIWRDLEAIRKSIFIYLSRDLEQQIENLFRLPGDQAARSCVFRRICTFSLQNLSLRSRLFPGLLLDLFWKFPGHCPEFSPEAF